MSEEHDGPKRKSEEQEESDSFKLSSLMAVVRRLGYFPYVLVCMGILTAIYSGKVPGEDGDSVKQFLKFLSAALFVSGILWSLVRLFQRLFDYRPARGLIDGLVCGIVAGIVGGQLGYGWYPTSTFLETKSFHDGSPYEFAINYVDPSYLRVLWALAFTVPIAGLLGLGSDLIHPNRKINWRRDLGIVLLVAAVVLLLIGFGIFKYVPTMNGKGISFSDIWLLFETFLIIFCAMMAWNFGWSLRKLAGRFSLVLLLIAAGRVVTWFMKTADPAQSGMPLWQRQYLGGSDLGDAQAYYDMALAVVLFCIWTLALYTAFYRNYRLTRRMDQLTEKFLR